MKIGGGKGVLSSAREKRSPGPVESGARTPIVVTATPGLLSLLAECERTVPFHPANRNCGREGRLATLD